MPKSGERGFIHDLNNKLAILDGRMSILILKLRRAEGLSPEEILTRAEEIKETIIATVELTARRRDAILAEERAA